ncbi:unnamed protein product [Phytophthora fragariaefolia]|uniref:Unnamed protein product n=1 Tax=Phytophthora fragariaefolia TaxID=1490495 RepID=A0A9W7CQX8_9STRA|nr:unnamed protein product [Phytophthora fragariaefolia]
MRLLTAGKYGNVNVARKYGLVTIETTNGWRVVLPPTLWSTFAVYSYNSAKPSTVALSPNEVMMGRRLPASHELLRRTEVTEAGELLAYDADLLERWIVVRNVLNVPVSVNRNAKHATIIERLRIGENFDQVIWSGCITPHEDKTGKMETNIAHVSFFISYYYPTPLLAQVALDIDEQFEYEDQQSERNEPEISASVLSATGPDPRTRARRDPNEQEQQ